MAKVKIPLVMKNGEKAKDMESLRENFDIESAIGYFLDGKLVKWLNDRYYEEEAEAVTQLDKSDANLPEKLCEIFGVNYSGGEEIDPEEIVRRKERLSRLKQLTDDESVLGEVDLVAFDQEELAELYDRGAEKIYLCEGTFQIPKSKQDLEYIPLCGAQVSGLKEREPSAQVQGVKGVSGATFGAEEYVIPLELADKINLSPYAVLQDYIVFIDDYGRVDEGSALFHLWNKYSGTETTFSIEGIQKGKEVEICAADSNRLLIAYKNGLRQLLLYDVELKTIQIICEDAEEASGGHCMSYKNGFLAYRKPDFSVQLLNIQGEKPIPICQIKNVGYFKFGFAGDFLIYGSDRKLKLYNVKTNKTTDAMPLCDTENFKEPPIELENHAYAVVIDSIVSNGELISIDLNAPELPPQKYKRWGRNIRAGDMWANGPYILSNRAGSKYALDLRTLTEKEIDITGLTGMLMQNIGDYLYFWDAVTERIRRVYLPDLKAEPVEITES